MAERVAPEVARIKRHTRLPVAVGFGIREPAQAAEIARIADAAVVGSALIDLLAGHLDARGPRRAGTGAGGARQGPGAGRGGPECSPMSWLTDYVRPKIRALYTREKPDAAREPVAAVPVLRADDLPPRPRGEPARLPALRPPHAGRPGLPLRRAVRRGQLAEDRDAEEPARPAALPRPEEAMSTGCARPRPRPRPAMRWRRRWAGSAACRR